MNFLETSNHLLNLLPGGDEFWLCKGNNVVPMCTVMTPLSLYIFLCFTLSQINNLSSTCLYWVVMFMTLTFTPVVLGLNINFPIFLFSIIILLIHLPLMNKRQSYIFIFLSTSILFGYFNNTIDFVLVIIAIISTLKLLFRIIISLLTIISTTPTTFVLPIVSHVMPRWTFNDYTFFRTDNPPENIASKRKTSYSTLYNKWNQKFAKTIEQSKYLGDKISDLRFCASNRVFIPYQKKLESWCDPATIVKDVDRIKLIDVDGNELIDVSGSYGVNVCGYDEYKKFITNGWELTKDVGCVLGPLHPLVRENIDMLRQISGKEEISFHMSGTEAVMSAARLTRYNTRKKYIVVFGGAYHGWWDGVQPLAGNERIPVDILTLKDMSPLSLALIKMRSFEIAGVLVNPLQAFHPNQPPPSDLVLASNIRDASDSTKLYKKWLEKLRDTCTKYKIVLIFDEVYTGFRLAPGGAQEYFNVQADMVVYGKTVGGGIANGIVCGPSKLMCRVDSNKPLRLAYIVGTFAAHPILVGSMNQFLKWVISKNAKNEYNRLRRDVQNWVTDCNKRLDNEFDGSPIQISAYASVWTIIYKKPGRYHWMLQYYLKDEGLNLSWVGTGRLNFSLDFTYDDLDEVTNILIKACHRMKEDGWWFDDVNNNNTQSKFKIQLELVGEIVRALLKRLVSF